MKYRLLFAYFSQIIVNCLPTLEDETVGDDVETVVEGSDELPKNGILKKEKKVQKKYSQNRHEKKKW